MVIEYGHTLSIVVIFRTIQYGCVVRIDCCALLTKNSDKILMSNTQKVEYGHRDEYILTSPKTEPVGGLGEMWKSIL